MRIPSAHHVEGFFLGAQYMIDIGRAKQRHGNSYLVEALQREYTNLALVAARPVTECKAGKSVSPPKPLKNGGTLSCSKYLNREKPKGLWRKYVLAGATTLFLFGVFVSLFARGAIIEGDWNHDRLCKYYGAEISVDQRGRVSPCP